MGADSKKTKALDLAINQIESMPNVINATELLSTQIVVNSGEFSRGVFLKGTDSISELSIIPNNMIIGNLKDLDEVSKHKIIAEIEADFHNGLSGIFKLPDAAKFGVYTAYKYYLRLLKKLKRVPSVEIKNKRIRVANIQKVDVLARSYVRYRFNIL